MSERKRVWVLGAGFSRSLGGPLLTQLLSEASYDIVQRVYGDVFDGRSLVKSVYRLYQFGTKYKAGCIENSDRAFAKDGQDIWPDAEVFLDELDAAAEKPDGPLAARLQAIGDRLDRLDGVRDAAGLRHLSAMARRLVVAECSWFLKDGALLETERWEPYRDWGSHLGLNDTVITFNYDRVAELAAAHGNFMKVVTTAEHASEARMSRCGQILKLHGSVDWCRRDDSVRRVKDQPEFALTCPDEQICIATPGPTKARTAKQLQALWRLAADALRNAESIVFLGYRFPPSDAEARKRLLGAIEANEHEPRIHTVLGENLSDPSSVRLQGLLRGARARAGRAFELTPHPLRAEDFLTIFDSERL